MTTSTIDRRRLLLMAAAAWAASRAGRASASPVPAALQRISEIIIPRTETPGAIDAGVPEFLWTLLNTWHRVDERGRFLAALRRFEAMSLSAEGSGPVADADYERALRECQTGQAGDEMRRFFESVQSLVVLGYYTSELGATTELRYDPIPGRFDGSLEFLEVGRQWST
jgi:hypothetical protein